MKRWFALGGCLFVEACAAPQARWITRLFVTAAIATTMAAMLLTVAPSPALAILVDSGFEGGADGTTLSTPWALWATPQKAEYDSLRAMNGVMSAWIKGPSTAAIGGAGETVSAMTANGSEHTFWVYCDNVSQRRYIDDNNATDASKAFTLYFSTGGVIQAYTGRAGNPNGYVTNTYTTVGTYATGWTQYKITYTFAGDGAQTYTLAKRRTLADSWTPLRGSGAGWDIPFRGTNTVTGTSGLLFRVYQNTNVWIDDIGYGTTATTHSVTASATPGGSITPLGTVTLPYGADSPIYEMTPDCGYFLSDVTVDGLSVTTTSYPPASYQFKRLRSAHTIKPVFTVPGTTEMRVGILVCSTCHSHHLPDRVCQDCHQPIGTASSVHTGTPSAWHPPVGATSCQQCHSGALTFEHNGRKTDAGAHIDCATCHRSKDPLVINAIATRNGSCVACHPAADPHGFAVPAVDYSTACRKCHDDSLAGTHPFHNVTGNCASCHSGWGTALIANVPTYLDTYGAFASASSKDTSASLLHIIHSTPRWEKSAEKASSKCASCHAVAACDVCHAAPLDPTHSAHASTATPWVGDVSRGVDNGDQTDNGLSVAEPVRCGAPTCHDTTGVAGSTPGLLDDSTHGAIPSLGYLANTVTKTGTWTAKTGAAYTRGKKSQSNGVGATLSVPFTGEQVVLVSEKDPYRGIGEILIDGVSKGTVDFYSDTTKNQLDVFRSEALPAGTHTITVRVTGTKRAAARDTIVPIDGVKVYVRAPGVVAPSCASCH